MPFELESVNVFLVRMDGGYLMVDAGLGTEECFEALLRALEQLGVHWSEIRALLITHAHPDHIGLVPRLREASGAPVWMHPIESRHLEEFADPEKRAAALRLALDMAGTPGEMQAAIDKSFSVVRPSIHPIRPERFLQGGETIPVEGGELEVFWTPGHSPGHICLYHRQRKYLIAGDHILETITPHVSWRPDRDALGDYLDSLALFPGIEVDSVLPSHGEPFGDHRRRIEAIGEHHAARCARLAAALLGGPRTAHALVPQLWNRILSPFHYHFAVLEVLAHCDYLERRGGLKADRKNGGAVEWTSS